MERWRKKLKRIGNKSKSLSLIINWSVCGIFEVLNLFYGINLVLMQMLLKKFELFKKLNCKIRFESLKLKVMSVCRQNFFTTRRFESLQLTLKCNWLLIIFFSVRMLKLFKENSFVYSFKFYSFQIYLKLKQIF